MNSSRSRQRESVSNTPAKRLKTNDAEPRTTVSPPKSAAPITLRTHANDVIVLKCFRSSMDIQDQSKELVSHPKFTNQIFEKEELVGYENPHVDIYYTAGSMKWFIQVTYRSKDKGATDIVSALSAKIEPSSLLKRELDFIKAADEPFRPPLTNLITEYTLPVEKTTFHIYKGNFKPPQSKKGMPATSVTKLRDYHASVQFLTLLSIDGASYIDTHDTKWELFMIFEKIKEDNFHFVGYATLYPFLGLKNGSFKEGFIERVRISQVLILPRYQGKGHGSRLLEVLYEDCMKRDCVEITVEDPSESFRTLRDSADLKNCVEKKLLDENVDAGKPPSKEDLLRIQKALKITKSQALRCYEMNILRCIEADDDERKTKLRLMIKRRLYREFSDVLGTFSSEDRKIKLAELYDDLEREYLTVLRRLHRRGMSCICLGM